MDNRLKAIPARIRELREVLELTPADMAEKLGITAEEYCNYEDGSLDIPISQLYEIAGILDIDLTVLITGETPKLNTKCIVRKGTGINVDRYEGYSYAALSYNFIGRVMEPLLVTLKAGGEKPEPVMHGGQEFNYVLSGSMKIVLGQQEHELGEGDCIYFDPNLPHSQEAVTDTATFLTVICE